MRLLALPAELYPHGAETLDFTGFPRYLLLRCEDEIAGCFAGDLLSQLSYTPIFCCRIAVDLLSIA